MGAFDSPPPEFVKQQLQASTVGKSERWRNAKLAESYYQSSQYQQLSSWDARGPLAKRRPREIIPIYKTTVDGLMRFTWGGSRFPRVIVGASHSGESAPDVDEVGPLLTDEDAREITTFVVTLIKQSKLERCAVEYSRRALVTGSAAVIVGTRGGYLTYSVEPGYHCQPTFDAKNPRRTSKIDILYQFEREVPITATAVGKKLFWFRRIIDDMQDVVYLPVEVRPGEEPTWTVDTKNSVNHGLGFCPVQWIRVFPLSPSAIDGQSLVDPALYSLLDRINYLYSQRSRAVEYGLDPQWIRKNVPITEREELQKNPGKIWDISDADAEHKASIEIAEVKGSGSDAAGEHLKDLMQRFQDSVGVIFSAMDKMSSRGNVSGVVLEYLHAPMIATAAELRKDLGDDGFCDLVNLAVRVAVTQVLGGADVWIQGIKKAAKKIDKAQLAGEWLDLPVRLQWGRFFSPTAQDMQLAVAAAMGARGTLVSQASATRAVSDFFLLTDIDAEVEELNTPLPDPFPQPQAGATPSKQMPLSNKTSAKPKGNASKPGKG